MPENEGESIEKYCWVKAVMQASPCDALPDKGACAPPWTLDCACGPDVMPPPPSPSGAADASGIKPCPAKERGGGTPPPSGRSIPRTPAESADQQAAAAGEAGDTNDCDEEDGTPGADVEKDYWQVASFAPGAELMPASPVVSLVFMPVRGTRGQVMSWRLLNPAWFRDAVAVTLLNYTS